MGLDLVQMCLLGLLCAVWGCIGFIGWHFRFCPSPKIWSFVILLLYIIFGPLILMVDSASYS